MKIQHIWEIGILIFLGINSWKDIRKREISLLLTGLFAVAGVAWMLYSRKFSVELLPVAGTVLLFFGISAITGGALGMGDALVLLALGTVMETELFFTMLFEAMLCSAVCAGILLVVLKKKRNTEIPFIPFLMLGYLGGMILCR